MRHLLTIRYLMLDPSSTRRAELPADADGSPVLGSTMGHDGPVVVGPVRELLTVETYGPCGPRTRMGIVHVLTGPRSTCFGCSVPLLDMPGNYYCAPCIAEQTREHAAERQAFDDFHRYADACARASR